MSRRGRSLWFLGVVVCCLGALSHGALWSEGSGQEVLAATRFVPHDNDEEPMSRLAVDVPQIVMIAGPDLTGDPQGANVIAGYDGEVTRVGCLPPVLQP